MTTVEMRPEDPDLQIAGQLQTPHVAPPEGQSVRKNVGKNCREFAAALRHDPGPIATLCILAYDERRLWID